MGVINARSGVSRWVHICPVPPTSADNTSVTRHGPYAVYVLLGNCPASIVHPILKVIQQLRRLQNQSPNHLPSQFLDHQNIMSDICC